MRDDNPFEVLQLPPTASEQEIVRQAARLCQRAGDESVRNRYREAARLLTADAGERALLALLTHPGAEHENADLERFQNTYRRPPASSAPPTTCPTLDISEVRQLLAQALAAELELAPLPLAAAVESSEPEEEIARQTVEALWQGLVADPRG
jgi:hypothetical protein